MKNQFIKTTFLLIIGGFITKILSMIIKIVMTRSVTTEVIGLYMMLMPTLSLIINLSQAGLPTAISKLVAEDKRDNKTLLFTTIPILILINTILMIFIFSFAHTLSLKLLHNKDLYLGIIAIALVIPFTSISSIIRSYFFGKNNVTPHILSNIVDCVVRILLYNYYLPLLSDKSNSYILCFLILSNVISEVASIIIMMLFLPRNIDIKKKDLVPDTSSLKAILSISIPNTGTRLIGSIGYFLEPIILVSTLKLVGYSTKYISYNYGIITGYVIPLILIPSFFSIAISQSLLPNISKDYASNNIKKVKRKIKLALFISIVIGFIFTFCFISVPKMLLRFIYHTELGVTYLRVLSPIFFIQYIDSILSSSLEAIGMGKITFKSNLIGTIVRCFSLFFFSLFEIGMWGLIISMLLDIVIVCIYNYIGLNNSLNSKIIV